MIHPRGAARGPSPGRGRVIHPGTTRRLRTHFRGGHRVCMCGPVGDGGEQRGSGGEGDGLDTNILYERMKALRAKEDEENTAVVDAAIERDQAIVAGIRGDAAERPMPSGEARREQNITSSDVCDAMPPWLATPPPLTTRTSRTHADGKKRRERRERTT